MTNLESFEFFDEYFCDKLLNLLINREDSRPSVKTQLAILSIFNHLTGLKSLLSFFSSEDTLNPLVSLFSSNDENILKSVRERI
jgi:hypothetical protein